MSKRTWIVWLVYLHVPVKAVQEEIFHEHTEQEAMAYAENLYSWSPDHPHEEFRIELQEIPYATGN